MIPTEPLKEHVSNAYDGSNGLATSLLDRPSDKSNDIQRSCWTIMHAAISYLMTTILFVHAALGCCWHEGHDCATCSHQLSMASEHDSCCKHHQKERQHCPAPCKCRLECLGACQTLPPQKTEVAKVTSAAPFDFVAVLSSESAARLELAGHWYLAPNFADPARPLRAHLLHQILLI